MQGGVHVVIKNVMLLFVAFYVDIVFPLRYHNYPSSMKFELLDDLEPR